MSKKKLYGLTLAGLIGISIIGIILWASQSTSTRHATTGSTLGQKSSQEALVESFKTGNKVTLQTITSANWAVPLSGLVNLNHPKAKQAGLKDHDEAIQVYAHHLQHPVHGDFLIDTGVARQFAEDPQSQGVPRWLAPQMGLDKIELMTATDDFIADLKRPLRGIFLTHLHLDHISGLPAIEKQVPLYIGQGESREKYFLFTATRGVVDTLLDGRPELHEWTEPTVDVFGDGSVFAMHSPGHTAGSTAYLVNTHDGPVLFTGDVSHTAWGWNNQVEPGKFSTDQTRSRKSLDVLLKLVKDHPEIEVRLGHQAF